MARLAPRARRASRLVVAGAALAGGGLAAYAPEALGARGQQVLVLGALALGMPHGAADTELLKAAAHGSRPRHAGLVLGYAALAAAGTAVVRRGGAAVERAVLVASAAHFGEGELACWGPLPAGNRRERTLLRAVAAVTATIALPAAVGRANRMPPEVGVTGAVAAPAGERSGAQLLRLGERPVAGLAALAVAAAGALALTGDLAVAADVALLTALDLLAPPSTSFAAYFGGWHALRHTARVVDTLVASGQLPEQRSLPRAVLALGRRSAWAAAVGLVGAGLLVARDPAHAGDSAFAAVLGLTVPHMTTVALEL